MTHQFRIFDPFSIWMMGGCQIQSANPFPILLDDLKCGGLPYQTTIVEEIWENNGVGTIPIAFVGIRDIYSPKNPQAVWFSCVQSVRRGAAMPKMKTHKGLKGRVRVTATGKVRYKRSFANHLMSGKSGGRVRRARKPSFLYGVLNKRFREALGK